MEQRPLIVHGIVAVLKKGIDFVRGLLYKQAVPLLNLLGEVLGCKEGGNSGYKDNCQKGQNRNLGKNTGSLNYLSYFHKKMNSPYKFYIDSTITEIKIQERL